MSLPTRNVPSGLPRPVRIFWILNVTLGVVCSAIELFCKFFLHLRWPYTWPLTRSDHWIDFFYFQPRFVRFHQLDVFSSDPSLANPYLYPAPVSLLYQGFYLTGPHCLVVFFVVTLGLVATLAVIFGKAMTRLGVDSRTTSAFILTTLLVSYPFWFEYCLGNMEICIFLFVAFGILAFLREDFYASAALIGIAASMKIFPFVYLALFLTKKKYREMAFAILAAFVLNIVSLWLLCPSLRVSYQGVKNGLNLFRKLYMLRYHAIETGFDHSIFGLFKKLFRFHYGQDFPPISLTIYLTLAVVVGLALYFIRIRQLPLLNQIVCLSIASILLPPTSHDYTLMHLYVPLALLILYAVRCVRSALSVESLIAPFVCFAILCSPESEVIYHRIGLSGQIKAITLIVLFILSLTRPWKHTVNHGVSDLGIA